MQARYYLDKKFDLQMKRSEKQALAIQEGSQPPAGGGRGDGSSLAEGPGPSALGRRSSGRRQLMDEFEDFDQSDDSSSASVSIRHKKKKPKRESAHSTGASRACGKAPASGGSTRASIAPPGGAARTTSNKEEEMWSPYLVVIEEISFENVAKYLRGSDGIAWRQSNNIAHLATAQELLEW